MSAEQILEKLGTVSLRPKIEDSVDFSGFGYDPETWAKIMKGGNLRLPRKLSKGEKLYMFPKYSLDVGGNFSGPSLTYYDQGRPVEIFVYEGESQKPTKAVSYTYELDNNYRHPLSDNPISAVRTLVKAWNCDSKGKKTSKFGIGAYHGVFGGEVGDSLTRKYTPLSESEYQLISNGSLETGGRNVFGEWTRKFIFSNGKGITYRYEPGTNLDPQLGIVESESDPMLLSLRPPEVLFNLDTLLF